MEKSTSPRWTTKAKGTFLAALAAGSSVSAAATAAGLSRESAYRLRSRNPRFASAWATAQAVAQDRRAEAWRTAYAARTPAEPFMRRRAIVYQGDIVGYRDRLDATALLRTLARLYASAGRKNVTPTQMSDTMPRKPAELRELPHPCRVNQCDPATPSFTVTPGSTRGR